MDLISVIVPVYKVEAYLDRCVQSIVEQTYRNLEIILVDDGSPDNCGAMCDAWAEKDHRIKVIHKENGGGAQARNTGLDAATGAYIAFVDSDDILHPQMYEYLRNVLLEQNCDIVECGYRIFTDEIGEGEVEQAEIEIYSTKDALEENIKDRVCKQLLWNKLYKRSVIGAVRMTEGKTIDDEFFTYRVIANAGQVAVSNRILYFYRQQPDSVMHQRYSLKWLAAVEAKHERLMFISKHFPELTSKASENLLFTCLYHGQLALKNLCAQEREIALRQLKQAVAEIPLPTADQWNALSLSHKLWLRLAKGNFQLCCRFRNRMKIGL